MNHCFCENCLIKCINCGNCFHTNNYYIYYYTIHLDKNDYSNLVNHIFLDNELSIGVSNKLKQNKIDGYFCQTCNIDEKYILKSFDNICFIKPEYDSKITRKRKRYTQKTYQLIV